MSEPDRRSSPPASLARAVQRLPGADLVLWAPRVFAFARRARRAEQACDEEPMIPAAPAGMPFIAAGDAGRADDRAASHRSAPAEGRRDRAHRQRAARRPCRCSPTRAGWTTRWRSTRTPPAPTDVAVRPAKLDGVAFERISFDSGYEPDARIPGAARWLAHERNRRHASLGRALLAARGAAMGRPPAPVPDGPRQRRPMFRSFGYRDRGRQRHPAGVPAPRSASVGAAQRRRRGGLRRRWRTCTPSPRRSGTSGGASGGRATQGATAIGVHGISLGGYTAALLAGIEDGLACVVAGVPPSEIVTLLARDAPPTHTDGSASREGSSATRPA